MFSYCLVGLSVRSLFCFTVLCIPSGYAIISLGKRELISDIPNSLTKFHNSRLSSSREICDRNVLERRKKAKQRKR